MGDMTEMRPTSLVKSRDRDGIPSSPPPSYEHVLEETRLAAAAQAELSARSSLDEPSPSCEKSPRRQDSTSATATPTPATPTTSSSAGAATVAAPRQQEILHKSSKELYRAVAKQWGITCKMSDHCRCLDCQSNYFDCDYDQNEQEKTDGGLSAGTPLFISEVMHGTACSIL